eukprot:1028817_1
MPRTRLSGRVLCFQVAVSDGIWIFFPNGNNKKSIRYVTTFLRLASLPPKVKSIQIARELRLIETNTVNNASSTFEKLNMDWGWPVTQLQTKEMQNLTTFTLSVKIDICGVYDHEDNDITNQYINTNIDESKQSPLQYTKKSDHKLLEVRLDSLTSSVDKLAHSFQSFEQR